MKKSIIIAEIGPNHNGSIKIAKKLILQAKKAGADYVKFQTFITENIITKSAQKAKYQIKKQKEKETQFQMLKKLQLSFDDFLILKKFCNKIKIKFLTTCFDFESVKFAKKLNMDFFKIPSGEITNLPLIKEICKSSKKIILSTGMSDKNEVRKAIKFILSNKIKKNNLILLHCNTEYPTPFEDVNLRAMVKMKNDFKLKYVGYSDHTLGITTPLVAISLGANIIEKHFTLNKKANGPDHKASLEPKEFKEMVNKIRLTEKILGSKIKKPTKSEKKNINIARKSIVANTNIKKGEIFTKKNIAIKRPGGGLAPEKWFKLLNQKSKKNYKKDQFI